MKEPPPIDEGVWPTPEQWTWLFLPSSEEKQIVMAERVLENSQTANTCFNMDHVRMLEHYKQRDMR